MCFSGWLQQNSHYSAYFHILLPWVHGFQLVSLESIVSHMIRQLLAIYFVKKQKNTKFLNSHTRHTHTKVIRMSRRKELILLIYSWMAQKPKMSMFSWFFSHLFQFYDCFFCCQISIKRARQHNDNQNWLRKPPWTQNNERARVKLYNLDTHILDRQTNEINIILQSGRYCLQFYFLLCNVVFSSDFVRLLQRNLFLSVTYDQFQWGIGEEWKNTEFCCSLWVT